MMNSEDPIALTKLWIERFVVGLDMCPFAKYSFDNKLIEYRISPEESFKGCMSDVVELIQDLATADHEEVSNAFILCTGDHTFEFMLDLDYTLSGLLEDVGFDQLFQTVVFHPDFRYEGEEVNAHGNYTNRSPYPMLHILRADEVTSAIEKYGNVDQIPDRNSDVLNQLKIKSLSEVFEDGFLENSLKIVS